MAAPMVRSMRTQGASRSTARISPAESTAAAGVHLGGRPPQEAARQSSSVVALFGRAVNVNDLALDTKGAGVRSSMSQPAGQSSPGKPGSATEKPRACT